MAFNIDGFNERMNYIHNSNDKTKLIKNGPSNIDNSFAKMRTEERKDLVTTTNQDQVIIKEEVSGDKEKFVIRNNAINNFNNKHNDNNPVARALNKHRFQK